MALEQRLIGPLRNEGVVLVHLIEPIKNLPCGVCAERYGFLEVLDWFMHDLRTRRSSIVFLSQTVYAVARNSIKGV